MRQVIIYPKEDGTFVAECPSLPGCISQGLTREGTIENIREAFQLSIKEIFFSCLQELISSDVRQASISHSVESN